MDIEVKIDEKYDNPKIVIYTNKVDAEISKIIDGIFSPPISICINFIISSTNHFVAS